MTRRITRERLIEVAGGDGELVTLLIEEGVVTVDEQGFTAEDVDVVLASRTLVRELGVNLPGVEIILRLRRELVSVRHRLAELEGDGD